MKTICFVGGTVGEAVKALDGLVIHYDIQANGVVLLNTDTKDSKSMYRSHNPRLRVVPVSFRDEPDVLRARVQEVTCDAVTCTREGQIGQFGKLLDIFKTKHVLLPSQAALQTATNKSAMRQAFQERCPEYTVPFTTSAITADTAIDSLMGHIRERLSDNFPLIVKPTNVSSSILVNRCDSGEELRKTLATVKTELLAFYAKREGRTGTPEIIVEAFVPGDMYSIDVYVNDAGETSCCPLVRVQTGNEVGGQGYFGFARISPAALNGAVAKAGEQAAAAAVHAVGLRNCTAHVELKCHEGVWKIIELAPRVGGFRERLYEQSHGFSHYANDVLVRLGELPVVKPHVRGVSALLQFFPEIEGRLAGVQGLEVLEHLDSFVEMRVEAAIGRLCRFASNGGTQVMNALLMHPSRETLLADISKAREVIKVVTYAAY